MSHPGTGWSSTSGSAAALAEKIIETSSRDLVFVMQFLGESQYRVLHYFQQLVIAELERRGVRREDHALLQVFIDSHATEMRDFVFNGVSMARPFHLEEMERMLGDKANVLRADAWDMLRNHIESVESKFLKEADDLPRQLAAIEAEAEKSLR